MNSLLPETAIPPRAAAGDRARRLELGCGARPTPGYLHQDVTAQPGVELDFTCAPWELPLPDGALDRVPFEPQHVWSTFYGWQRWPGDEHKSGWTRESLFAALDDAGFAAREEG